MSSLALDRPKAGPAAPTLPLAWRLARRELRGGLRNFRILIACLVIGVAAVAGVRSLSDAMLAGLQRDARALLGGDVELRLVHRVASPEEAEWLRANSAAFSETAELRTMARNPADPALRRLVELKAVDEAYPLHGTLETEPAGGTGLLAEREGHWGAIVDPALLDRLGLAVGDRLEIGEVPLVVTGVLQREPDRAARLFALGPRVLIARQALAASGLEQPGSLIYYHYRLDLPAGQTPADWRGRLDAAFPQAGWRLRGLDEAAPGMRRFIDQVGAFMTLVGLTALLVGGVGVANGVTAFLETRRETIATLKCLGAPARLILATYLLQVLALGGAAVVAGLLLGAAVPVVLGPLLAARLGFPLVPGFYPLPLAVAAASGLLILLAFALWPLARAQRLPAGSLFRDLLGRERGLPPRWSLVAVAVCGLLLALLALVTSDDPWLAAGFIGGSLGVLLVCRGAAELLRRLAARAARVRNPTLRLALANLHRPGAPTGSVVTSLGLGLTVLVAVALIQGNLEGQILDEIPAEAPGFYFIDIQPDEVERFDRLVQATPGVERLERVPMLRGRITGVNGRSPDEMDLPADAAWVFRGDRGITWSAQPPPGSTITAGSWWPPDYQGPPLVSLDDDIAKALGLAPGDRLTINLLGRSFEATIANLRPVEWRDLRINFVMVFSPGLVQQAPQTQLAAVYVDPEAESRLERAVTDAFPNVSAIRVKEALAQAAATLEDIALAITATAAVTLVSGGLVLAGAVAAGQRRRLYESVVLKVLGATRGRLTGAFLLEFGLLGLGTSLVALVFGAIAAWAVCRTVMEIEFVLLPWRAGGLLLAAVTATLLLGFLGTWRALSQKAAPFLRNP